MSAQAIILETLRDIIAALESQLATLPPDAPRRDRRRVQDHLAAALRCRHDFSTWPIPTGDETS